MASLGHPIVADARYNPHKTATKRSQRPSAMFCCKSSAFACACGCRLAEMSRAGQPRSRNGARVVLCLGSRTSFRSIRAARR